MSTIIPSVARALSTSLSYNATGKARFHRAAKHALQLVADELKLTPGSYDLRSNKAGIAVSGEVTLHTDTLYVQVSQSFISDAAPVLFRTCKGRKDYCGGRNNWASAELLDDTAKFAETLKRLHYGIDWTEQRGGLR